MNMADKTFVRNLHLTVTVNHVIILISLHAMWHFWRRMLTDPDIHTGPQPDHQWNQENGVVWNLNYPPFLKLNMQSILFLYIGLWMQVDCQAVSFALICIDFSACRSDPNVVNHPFCNFRLMFNFILTECESLTIFMF